MVTLSSATGETVSDATATGTIDARCSSRGNNGRAEAWSTKRWLFPSSLGWATLPEPRRFGARGEARLL